MSRSIKSRDAAIRVRISSDICLLSYLARIARTQDALKASNNRFYYLEDLQSYMHVRFYINAHTNGTNCDGRRRAGRRTRQLSRRERLICGVPSGYGQQSRPRLAPSLRPLNSRQTHVPHAASTCTIARVAHVPSRERTACTNAPRTYTHTCTQASLSYRPGGAGPV